MSKWFIFLQKYEDCYLGIDTKQRQHFFDTKGKYLTSSYHGMAPNMITELKARNNVEITTNENGMQYANEETWFIEFTTNGIIYHIGKYYYPIIAGSLEVRALHCVNFNYIFIPYDEE
jgi:hypothetical protein